MSQHKHIPAYEHENVLGAFWQMMKECESTADNNEDPVLRHWVEGWHAMWNRVTGDDAKPAWVRRASISVKASST